MKKTPILVIAILLGAGLGAWIVGESRFFGLIAGAIGGLVLGVALLGFHTGADETNIDVFKD